MRIWLMVLVPAAAVSGLNTAYSAWRTNPLTKMTEVRRQCVAKASDYGLSSSVGFDLCNCMVDKATSWKRTYPGAEYTRETHLSFSKECLAALPESSSESSFGLFGSDPDALRSSGFAPEPGWGQPPEAASRPESDADYSSEERSTYGRPKQYGDPGFGTE
jgi:hypothetical protein